MTLTLISHHLCPYVQRVAIALREKRIAFEQQYIDLAAKPSWFTAISPLGKVPLLRLGDEVLFESAAICDYLEDAYPDHPLHPASPVQRAKHRGWIEFASATLADIWGFETAPDAVAAQRKAAALRVKFLHVEKALRDGPFLNDPFFNGAAFSLVDAAFAPVFRYFDVFDVIADFGIFDELDRVQIWRAALASRPSVQDAVTPDYAARLHLFLAKHRAYLHQLTEGMATNV
ncbi:MAG TPA: glutathione S-transferase family protein [Dongiaceae bacterium]